MIRRKRRGRFDLLQVRLYHLEIRAVWQSTILLNLSVGMIVAFLFADLAEVCEALAERAMSNWRAADIAAKWQHIAEDLSGIDARIL